MKDDARAGAKGILSADVAAWYAVRTRAQKEDYADRRLRPGIYHVLYSCVGMGGARHASCEAKKVRLAQPLPVRRRTGPLLKAG